MIILKIHFMHFAFINELFTNRAATALCWTLIHSLWQGLLFVITTGIIIMLTKKSRPSVRYNILSAQFLLFILVPVFTFIREWNNSVSGKPFEHIVNNNDVVTGTSTRVLSVHPGIKQQFLTTVSNFLSEHASLIVTVWFIILIVKSIKITSS